MNLPRPVGVATRFPFKARQVAQSVPWTGASTTHEGAIPSLLYSSPSLSPLSHESLPRLRHIALSGLPLQEAGLIWESLQRGSQSLVATHNYQCASRHRSSSLTLKLQCSPRTGGLLLGVIGALLVDAKIAVHDTGAPVVQ
jgi:hypothetical protein